MTDDTRFPVKMSSAIFVVFALVIAGMYLYRPIMTKVHIRNLFTEGETADRAVEFLVNSDQQVEDYLVRSIPENPGVFRWNALRVLDEREALGRMPEIVTLNYMLLKGIRERKSSHFMSFGDISYALQFILEGNYYVASCLGNVVYNTQNKWEINEDRIDHMWVLGIKEIVCREVSGKILIARRSDIKRYEIATLRIKEFIESETGQRYKDILNRRIGTGNRAFFFMVNPKYIRDRAELWTDFSEKAFLKLENGKYMCEAKGNYETLEFLNLIVTLSGFELDFRGNEIIVRMPGERFP